MRNDILKLGLGRGDVDGDDLLVGRAAIGLEVEDGVVVAEAG